MSARLWPSHGRGIPTQPFRAGLMFSGRPSPGDEAMGLLEIL
jgi:hypothetical protein